MELAALVHATMTVLVVRANVLVHAKAIVLQIVQTLAHLIAAVNVQIFVLAHAATMRVILVQEHVLIHVIQHA